MLSNRWFLEEDIELDVNLAKLVIPGKDSLTGTYEVGRQLIATREVHWHKQDISESILVNTVLN